MKLQSTLAASLAGSVTATNLYVASYGNYSNPQTILGNVAQLELTSSPDGSYSLTLVSLANPPVEQPSWLIDNGYGTGAYLVGETTQLYAFDKAANGSLTTSHGINSTCLGPVHATLYNSNRALALFLL